MEEALLLVPAEDKEVIRLRGVATAASNDEMFILRLSVPDEADADDGGIARRAKALLLSRAACFSSTADFPPRAEAAAAAAAVAVVATPRLLVLAVAVLLVVL